MKLDKLVRPMAVEQLVFMVPPEAVERWIELDHEIWSEGLSRWPGYVRKEVWQSSSHPGRLTVTIYWSDYDAWKAIDPQWLAETEALFDSRFTPHAAAFVEALHEGDQNFLIAASAAELDETG